jgi:hypothetical protein
MLTECGGEDEGRDFRPAGHGGLVQAVAAVDEDERGGVHEVGPRRRIGKTLAVSAARPAKGL